VEVLDLTKKTKGRGHTDSDAGETQDSPQKSIEGWVIFVTGIHEEAEQDNVEDVFDEYGKIISIKFPINLSRLENCMGYAIIEYATFEEAQSAIEKGNGQEINGLPVAVDWAFVKGK